MVQDKDRPIREKISVYAVSKAWRTSARRVVNSSNSPVVNTFDIAQRLKRIPGGFPIGNVIPYRLRIRIVPDDDAAAEDLLGFTTPVMDFLQRYPLVGLIIEIYGSIVGCEFNEQRMAVLKNTHLQSLEIIGPSLFFLENFEPYIGALMRCPSSRFYVTIFGFQNLQVLMSKFWMELKTQTSASTNRRNYHRG